MSTPRTLRRRNVMLNGFTSYISNAPKEFSRAPEMSSFKMSSQPRMLLKNPISRISLKKLQGLGNTHCMGHFNKKMNVVWHYFKFVNLKSIFFSYFSQNFFTKFSKFFKLKWVFSIFRLPHEVKGILPNCMSEMCKFHFFSSCAKFKNTAHTITNVVDVCADSGAHYFYSFQNLRNRRLDIPSAKAQGILCM